METFNLWYVLAPIFIFGAAALGAHSVISVGGKTHRRWANPLVPHIYGALATIVIAILVLRESMDGLLQLGLNCLTPGEGQFYGAIMATLFYISFLFVYFAICWVAYVVGVILREFRIAGQQRGAHEWRSSTSSRGNSASARRRPAHMGSSSFIRVEDDALIDVDQDASSDALVVYQEPQPDPEEGCFYSQSSPVFIMHQEGSVPILREARATLRYQQMRGKNGICAANLSVRRYVTGQVHVREEVECELLSDDTEIVYDDYPQYGAQYAGCTQRGGAQFASGTFSRTYDL